MIATPRRSFDRLHFASVLLVLAAGFGGCESSGTTSLEVAPGDYTRAFDAARQTLVNARYPVERVDAARGVIATGAKPTSGLATPWEPDSVTLAGAWSDLVNEHHRVVRVTFDAPDEMTSLPPDLRAYTGPLVMDVDVTILRARHRGYRAETESVALGSRWVDPVATAAGYDPSTLVPLRSDDEWASLLVDGIREGLAQPSDAADAREPEARSNAATGSSDPR